jgi:hypothetical protein
MARPLRTCEWVSKAAADVGDRKNQYLAERAPGRSASIARFGVIPFAPMRGEAPRRKEGSIG